MDLSGNGAASTRSRGLVEKCFGRAGQSLHLLAADLTGEGDLTSLFRKKLKARQFFSINDSFLHGNIVTQKENYKNQHVISLENDPVDSAKRRGISEPGGLLNAGFSSAGIVRGGDALALFKCQTRCI